MRLPEPALASALPSALLALASLVSALAALSWSIRRRP